MRIWIVANALAITAACGGSEPASAPKAEAPAPEKAEKKEEAPKEEPKAEEAGDKDLSAMSDEDKLAYLMELGEKVYTTGGSGGVACVTCHQANGEGLPPSFPPLKGAEEWMGSCEQHAGYVIHGLKGEIEVAGTKYNGVMPAQGNLSDLEIAAVITYERQSWGNDFGHCEPEAVAKARTLPAPTGPGK